MRALNLVITIFLGVLSIPGFVMWPGLLPFSDSVIGAIVNILGWLAWGSLFILCINYKELGRRPLPLPVFIFGGIATMFFLSIPITFVAGIWKSESDVTDGMYPIIVFLVGLWPSLLFVHLAGIHMREFKRNIMKNS